MSPLFNVKNCFQSKIERELVTSSPIQYAFYLVKESEM